MERYYIYVYVYVYVYVYNACYLDSMRRVHLQKEFTVTDIQKTMTYFDLHSRDNRQNHLH